MTQNIPEDKFRCHRTFVYQGRTLDCDDHVERDGENLRPILKDVPEAISQLDEYQQTRRNLTKVPYVISGAILLALGGYVASRSTGGFRTPVREVSPGVTTGGEINPAYIVLVGGLAIAAGAFTYGFIENQRNEARLSSAVNTYNEARPNSPIQLEFKTGFHF